MIVILSVPDGFPPAHQRSSRHTLNGNSFRTPDNSTRCAVIDRTSSNNHVKTVAPSTHNPSHRPSDVVDVRRNILNDSPNIRTKEKEMAGPRRRRQIPVQRSVAIGDFDRIVEFCDGDIIACPVWRKYRWCRVVRKRYFGKLQSQKRKNSERTFRVHIKSPYTASPAKAKVGGMSQFHSR